MSVIQRKTSSSSDTHIVNNDKKQKSKVSISQRNHQSDGIAVKRMSSFDQSSHQIDDSSVTQQFEKVRSVLNNQSPCLNSSEEDIESQTRQISTLLKNISKHDSIFLNPYLLGIFAIALLILIHKL